MRNNEKTMKQEIIGHRSKQIEKIDQAIKK